MRTSIRLLTTFLALVVIGLAADVSSAALIVGDAPLKMPTGNSFIDYTGMPNNFTDVSNTTDAEQQYNLSHVFSLGRETILMDNVANTNHVKLVWLHLVFDSASATPQNNGQVFDPSLWATFENTPGVINVTGVATLDNGIDRVDVWQTWTITPQPGSEEINISQLIANSAGGISSLQLIEVKTACVPEPSSFSMGVLSLVGLIAVGWRRQRKTAA